jgi:hypothetical protein
MWVSLVFAVGLAAEPEPAEATTTASVAQPGTADAGPDAPPAQAPSPASPPTSTMTCPPWLQDAPATVCTPAAPGTVDEDLIRIRRSLDLATGGVAIQSVALPLYLGMAGLSVPASRFGLTAALPTTVGTGGGTLMGALGLERATRLLAERHVTVPRAPLIVGSVLGGLGFALEAGGAIAWGAADDEGAGVVLASVGAGLHTGSIAAFSVGIARARRAATLLRTAHPPTADSSRPHIQVAPNVDIATRTIGIAGVW